MWKYTIQIKIRWLSFILGLIIIGLLLFYYKNNLPSTQTEMKISLASVQFAFENQPIWVYSVIIVSYILLMLFGVPSVFMVFPLMIVKNCTFAYIVVCICQIVASLIAMWISYNYPSHNIPDILREKLEDNKEEYQSFAFWSRVYYNVPLRTIDRLTPIIHRNSEIFLSSLIAAASAIMIRLCIPSLLIKHIVDQFTLLEPNPGLERTKLMVWAIILIVYTVLPKVPELMICPKKVKKVIYEIETPTENGEVKTEN